MGIGASVFLLAVGAVLAFAVTGSASGIDVHVVGWILMACGALGLFFTTMVFDRGRRGLTTARVVDPYPDAYAEPVVEERVVSDAPVVERRTRYRTTRITRY
jgi:hypothetical protein